MATPIKKKAKAKKPPARADARVLYLYGISQPARKKLEFRAEAVDGMAAIEPLRFGSLACWVSRVDRREFAEHLAENMENLEWLATVGVRHQRAVADLASKIEMLPARFGTVFLSEASLQEHVESTRKGIAAVFKRIAGADEWGVKIFRDTEVARPAMIEAASGTDYLKRKAQTVMPRTKEEDPALQGLLRNLQKVSVESAPGGKASTGQPNLLWHGSFLVRRGAHKKFSEALRKFTSEFSDAYRVECSGPWPPYSFVGQHG